MKRCEMLLVASSHTPANHPFLFFSFRDLASFLEKAIAEGNRRTFCRNLCQRTFHHWESLWAYTFMADMCFEYADYGCDGTVD